MMSFHNLSYPGPFELIWGLISFALVIGFVVSLIIVFSRRRPSYVPPSSAVSILEERYARGEIGRDEFLERRDVLLRKDAPPS